MSLWLLRDARTGRVLAGRMRRADGWLTRTLGFLPRSSIAADEGLWFARCRGVHTLGMRVPLDVVFLDRRGCVIGIDAAVGPGRWHVREARADAVAEFAAGFAAAQRLAPGDELVLERLPD